MLGEDRADLISPVSTTLMNNHEGYEFGTANLDSMFNSTLYYVCTGRLSFRLVSHDPNYLQTYYRDYSVPTAAFWGRAMYLTPFRI